MFWCLNNTIYNTNIFSVPNSERAVSNNVELVTLTSLQYHNGYFHLKIVSLISIFLLSLTVIHHQQK